MRAGERKAEKSGYAKEGKFLRQSGETSSSDASGSQKAVWLKAKQLES